MRCRIAPGPIFAGAVLASLGLALWLVWIATGQPWLGLQLRPEGNAISIAATAPGAPAPPDVAGSRLVWIAAEGEPPLVLWPVDLSEEPDMLGTAERVERFLERQERIHRILQGGVVRLGTDRGDSARELALAPAPGRPLADLPAAFWIQVFVGFTGLSVGAWVLCLRPRDLSAWLLLLAGVGLALSSGAAALYSTRELALPAEAWRVLSRLNSCGALTFGIGMLTLFLIHPRRILPAGLVAVPGLLIAGWVGVVLFVDWPRYLPTVQDATALIMLALLVAILAQVLLNRRDPVARAALGWFGLSVAIGAGGFVLTTMLPFLMGEQAPWLRQSHAFLFFLLIYGGIAMAVARYRLFDLSSWSLQILSYGIGVALLLLLDAALIYGLSLDRAPALGLALAAVGTVYLPLRDRLWQGRARRREMPADALFAQVTEIAHADDTGLRIARLRELWTEMFQPLAIRLEGEPDGPAGTGCALVDHGRALDLASAGGLPAMRLELAGRGARLFSSADVARARSILALLDRNLRQHRRYREAVDAERTRINRDMHDNIGVLLLGALHTSEPERKDLLIRQTLADLREIISNPDQSAWHLPRLVADLRAEIIAHLEAADIAVTWEATELPDIAVPPQVVHTLRAVLREGCSNIVRHSGAREAMIALGVEDGCLLLRVADNGRGFDACSSTPGQGCRNLSERVAQAGGRFDLQAGPTGTALQMCLPLQPAPGTIPSHGDAAP